MTLKKYQSHSLVMVCKGLVAPAAASKYIWGLFLSLQLQGIGLCCCYFLDGAQLNTAVPSALANDVSGCMEGAAGKRWLQNYRIGGKLLSSAINLWWLCALLTYLSGESLQRLLVNMTVLPRKPKKLQALKCAARSQELLLLNRNCLIHSGPWFLFLHCM